MSEARAAVAKGQLDEARQWAVQGESSHPYEARKLLADIERKAAQEAMAQQNLEEAVAAFERAIAAEPTPALRAPDALEAARISATLGKTDDQIRLLDRALEFDPATVAHRKLAAAAFDELGDYPRAIRQYLWLWEADRNQVNYGSRLAVLYLENAQHADAAAVFKVLLEADPTNVQAALGRVEALSALGRWDEAERQLRDIQSRFPENPGLMIRLATFLDQRGKPQEAQKLRDRAQGELPGVKRRKMRKLR